MLNNYVFPAEIATRLRKNVKGALFTDLANRGRYATDASIYQQFPLAVLIPEDAEDVKTALAVAAEFAIPVLPRGGGTSQCGQTTGAALVIDIAMPFAISSK